MSKPHHFEEMLAQPSPTAEAPEQTNDPWVSWDALESPVFNDSELYDELKRPAPRRPADPAPAAAATLEPPTEPVERSLGAQLWTTPAPAVGKIGVDCMQRASALAVALQEFTGTGAYAPHDGRSAQRAAVVTVDREPIGRYVATTEWPGRRYVAPEAFTPPFGAGSDDATLKWLGTVVAGTREAVRLPVLVVVADGYLPADRLETLAREASCIVAVVQHRPGVAQPVWEPRLLEPKPEPPAPPEPPAAAPKPRAAPRRPATAGRTVTWLAGVAELVRDHPETISGPHGERVSVSYGHSDAKGRPYVELRASTERGGHLWPSTVEIAPGVEVDMTDCRVYV